MKRGMARAIEVVERMQRHAEALERDLVAKGQTLAAAVVHEQALTYGFVVKVLKDEAR